MQANVLVRYILSSTFLFKIARFDLNHWTFEDINYTFILLIIISRIIWCRKLKIAQKTEFKWNSLCGKIFEKIGLILAHDIPNISNLGRLDPIILNMQNFWWIMHLLHILWILLFTVTGACFSYSTENLHYKSMAQCKIAVTPVR